MQHIDYRNRMIRFSRLCFELYNEIACVFQVSNWFGNKRIRYKKNIVKVNMQPVKIIVILKNEINKVFLKKDIQV